MKKFYPICLALLLSVFLAIIFTVCGGGGGGSEDISSRDGNSGSKVTLSAEEIAGPGGKLVYQGEEYTDELEVPYNALIGVMKDGQPYLYHPAQGDVELSWESSTRAVGYFLIGPTGDSSPTVANYYDSIAPNDLDIGESKELRTGLKVERIAENEVRVTNLCNRWVAIKGGDLTKPVFITPSRATGDGLNIITVIRKRLLNFHIENNNVDIQTSPGNKIETFGAIIRAYPLLLYAPMADKWLSDIWYDYEDEILKLLPYGFIDGIERDMDLTFWINVTDMYFFLMEGLQHLAKIPYPAPVDIIIDALVIAAHNSIVNLGENINHEIFWRGMEDLAESAVKTIMDVI